MLLSVTTFVKIFLGFFLIDFSYREFLVVVFLSWGDNISEALNEC